MLDKHQKPFEYYVQKFAKEEIGEEITPVIISTDHVINKDIIDMRNNLLRNLNSELYSRSIKYNIVNMDKTT